MKDYIKPEVEVITFKTEDIIVTSDVTPLDPNEFLGPNQLPFMPD